MAKNEIARPSEVPAEADGPDSTKDARVWIKIEESDVVAPPETRTISLTEHDYHAIIGTLELREGVDLAQLKEDIALAAYLSVELTTPSPKQLRDKLLDVEGKVLAVQKALDELGFEARQRLWETAASRPEDRNDEGINEAPWHCPIQAEIDGLSRLKELARKAVNNTKVQSGPSRRSVKALSILMRAFANATGRPPSTEENEPFFKFVRELGHRLREAGFEVKPPSRRQMLSTQE